MPTDTQPLTLPPATTRAAHLTLDAAWDRLTVLEYGVVWDGPDRRLTRALAEDGRIGFLLGGEHGPVLGFTAVEPHEVDPEAIEGGEAWHGPRFSVPLLGLDDACVGEVLLAVRARFAPGEPTTDAMYFHEAVEASQGDARRGEDPEVAIELFRMALEAGYPLARFGLGYTLVEAGRPREGYDQLRRYAELAPHNAWAWCWLGRAAAEIGETGEALRAYERAQACTAAGAEATDAEDFAAALRGRRDDRG